MEASIHEGDALPAEMLPSHVAFNGVDFQLGSCKPDALVSRGQSVPSPAGDFNRIYILAASANGDRDANFRLGDHVVNLNIQSWTGFRRTMGYEPLEAGASDSDRWQQSRCGGSAAKGLGSFCQPPGLEYPGPWFIELVSALP